MGVVEWFPVADISKIFLGKLLVFVWEKAGEHGWPAGGMVKLFLRNFSAVPGGKVLNSHQDEPQ